MYVGRDINELRTILSFQRRDRLAAFERLVGAVGAILSPDPTLTIEDARKLARYGLGLLQEVSDATDTDTSPEAQEAPAEGESLGSVPETIAAEQPDTTV